jgi:hypothetical protein
MPAPPMSLGGSRRIKKKLMQGGQILRAPRGWDTVVSRAQRDREFDVGL